MFIQQCAWPFDHDILPPLVFSWVEAPAACQAPVEELARDMEFGVSSQEGDSEEPSSTRLGKRGAGLKPGLICRSGEI